MKIITSVEDQEKLSKELINDNRDISLIPTMGNLHLGHESLLKSSDKDDYRVSSLFINPLQFDDLNDYNNYPKTIEKDIKILKSYKIDCLFLPDKEAILQNISNSDHLNLPKFTDTLCGQYRKNHFEGVFIIVKKLFEIIQPSKAYFGKKDYQQILLIKHLVNKFFDGNIEIIQCETIRENNGLAMSSRNSHLTQDQKNLAAMVYKEICFLKEVFLDNKDSFNENKLIVLKNLSDLGIKIEYLEILSRNTLTKPRPDDKEVNIFVAYYIGTCRLIDNIEI